MEEIKIDVERLEFAIKKDNFLEWCEYFLVPYLDTSYQREDYYEEWNKIINNREPFDKPNRSMLRLLEEIARGHSKSLFLAEFLTIYDACTVKYPIQAVGSATNGQTKERADKIKRHLLQSPYLRSEFVPDSIARLDTKTATSTSNTQWNQDKIVLKNGAVIHFRSMQQEWSGLHVNKAVLDDPVAKKQSKLSDNECIRTFQYDIIPTLKSLKADLVVILTPVRPKDLGRNIRKLGFFTIHSYPAIKDYDSFKSIVETIYSKNNIHLDSFSARCKWLMKNQDYKFKLTKKEEDSLKRLCLGKKRFGWKGYMQTYAEQGKIPFTREYMLDIKGSQDSVIPKTFLNMAKEKGATLGHFSRRYLTWKRCITVWDFSFSKSPEADKTACILMFEDGVGDIGIQLLWEAQPRDYPNWKQEVFSRMQKYCDQFQCDSVVAEVNSLLQLTDDIKNLRLPLKPIWTGNTDTTAKDKFKKNSNRNFGNMVTINKEAAISRLGTAFENKQLYLVSGCMKSSEQADDLIEELESWTYNENMKIVENGKHPDAGFCIVLGHEHLKSGVGSQRIASWGFIK